MKFRSFLVLVLALVVWGCAPSKKARLEQVDTGVHGTLKAVDTWEMDAYNTQKLCGAAVCFTWAAHQQFSKEFGIALKAGKTFHLAVRAWKAGQPMPDEVVRIKTALDSVSELIKSTIPAGPNRDVFKALVDAAITAVNTAIATVLGQQQADLWMPRPATALGTGGGR